MKVAYANNVISGNDEFQEAMTLYRNSPNLFEEKYGPIGDLDTSKVTDMSHAFDGMEEFDEDISGWDMSNVVNTKAMFSGCRNFTGKNIGEKWNVSNVCSMFAMFCGCTQFNEDISNWNVENVANFNSFLFNCSNFNQDVSSWNIKGVRRAAGMFQGCKKFNQDLSSWQVHEIQVMISMFEGCDEFSQDLSSWQISRLTNADGMLRGCTKYLFKQPHLKEWLEVNRPIIDVECCVTFNIISENDKYIVCETCDKHFCYQVKIQWVDNYLNCPHCKSQWKNEIVYHNC